MFSRFATTTSLEREQKLKDVHAKNTIKANYTVARTFRAFLKERGHNQDFENMTTASLNEHLSVLYFELRKTDGEMYKCSSLKNFRHGLNRYLQASGRQIDLIHGNEFVEANKSFNAAMVELKRSGMGGIVHYPEIVEDDLKKLYNSNRLDTRHPCGLQNKVQFDIRFYFSRRGIENMHLMKKSEFVVKTGRDGTRYVCKRVDSEFTKNHRENDFGSSGAGFMPELKGSDRCPVLSFEKYISKLSPLDRLWQMTKSTYSESDNEWFVNRPLGEKTLQGFMPLISNQCNLSKRYTNHSIRATNTTILKRNNFSDAQVMSVSGHKAASSLSVYHRVSEPEKVAMGNVLTDALNATNRLQPSVRDDETSGLVLDSMDLTDFDTYLKGSQIFRGATFHNCKFVVNVHVSK